MRGFEARPRGLPVAFSAEAEKVRIENSFTSQLTNCMSLFPPFVGEHRRKTLGEVLGFLPLVHTGEKATYIDRPGTRQLPPQRLSQRRSTKTHPRSGCEHHSPGNALCVSVCLCKTSELLSQPNPPCNPILKHLLRVLS